MVSMLSVLADNEITMDLRIIFLFFYDVLDLHYVIYLYWGREARAQFWAYNLKERTCLEQVNQHGW